MSIKLKGSSDGSVSFDAPADTSPSGSDITLTLPTSAGSADQFLKNSGIAGELEYSSMVETSTGVGIGTTSPGFRCQVDSPVALSGSGNDYYFVAGNTSSASRRAVALGADGVGGNAVIAGYNTFSRGLATLIVDGSDVQVRTGGTERARLDSSGRLLAGTTSSSGNFRAVFQGNSGNSAAGGDVVLARGAATPANAQALGLLGFSDSTHTASGVIQCKRDGGTWSGSSKPTLMAFQTCADGSTTPTERMRITNAGILNLNGQRSGFGTPMSGSGNVRVAAASAGGIAIGTFDIQNYTAVQFVREVSGTATQVGTITCTSTATAYNTSSDYRLKENIVNLDGAITRVKQLAPKRFNFIADADRTVDGFLAHEAQIVVPEAVTGTQNEVDDDGNAVMQGIDQSKLVPLLTAALQEAIAKIETLETKVAALEAA